MEKQIDLQALRIFIERKIFNFRIVLKQLEKEQRKNKKYISINNSLYQIKINDLRKMLNYLNKQLFFFKFLKNQLNFLLYGYYNGTKNMSVIKKSQLIEAIETYFIFDNNRIYFTNDVSQDANDITLNKMIEIFEDFRN